MMKIEESISEEQRYAIRLMALSKTDSQIGQSIPDNILIEKALRDGVSSDRVMRIYKEYLVEKTENY